MDIATMHGGVLGAMDIIEMVRGGPRAMAIARGREGCNERCPSAWHRQVPR